jgi:WAS protein family homolog 1
MAQILQPYELPLVYSDLSPAETLRDALHAIKSLTKTVDEIFDKIDTRLVNERQRLGNINKRVSKCHEKIRQVQGSKKAITVFSTAKFPAAKTLPFYSTLIPDAAEISTAYREAGDEQYFLASPKYSLIGNPDLHVEVITILSRLNSYGTDMERVELIIEDEGLGTLPNYVLSVGSLLLFNSSINLYKEYQTQDNLISTGRLASSQISVILSAK